MRCPHCGAEGVAGAKFCGHCGTSLSTVCPACGAANPPDHKFCGQCGARLDAVLRDAAAAAAYTPRHTAPAAPTAPGEMKLATVLDCDIAGSTPLTTRLGPEGMHDLVQRFLDASAAEVRRYGGTIPQFKGDGFLALFGLPLTHEDHVRRALLAALAIQKAVAAGDDLEVSVRIGIDSGLVYYGPVADSLTLENTVIGEPPIIAVRLQSEAQPGSVLISEDSYREARDYARVEPVGALALKGIARPVSAYRLVGVSHRRSGLREAVPARSAQFVDRDGELAALMHVLEEVEAGRGRAVGLVGEPGIGKSRMLAEFRRRLGTGRVDWVEGRCLSYGTQIPYMLVLDTLRSNCGIGETDPPEAVAEKLRATLREVGIDPDDGAPVLLQLLDVKEGELAPALANPEVVKNKAFETLRQICLRASRVRPLVLAIEDLHWVDKVSEEFLDSLADRIGAARILMIGTHRPGYRPPWIERSYGAQIAMPPLSQTDSLEIVRSVLSAQQALDLVARDIVAKADGNPLFLEQLALHAGEAGDLRSGLLVPNTIREVVMARIDRLPEAPKRAVQLAAVIGREFPLRLLRAVWPGPGSVQEALRALVRLEFLDEWPDDEGTSYVFRHALTQETAYGSLLERHRRGFHGSVAVALEQLYAGRAEEVAELLALHFGRGDNAEKAVDYATLAAEKAQRRWANADALAYFADALARLDRLPDTPENRRRRIDAVLKQGEVKFALGQHTDQIDALDRLRPLVEQTDDPRRRATWHYWRGFLHSLTGGRPDIAIDHCNQAARVAAAARLDDIEAFAESCLAQIYVIAGELHQAIAAGERALKSFEARGDLWWACRTIWHLSPASIALGDWGASLDYCRRALEYGAALQDLRIKAVGLWRMGATYIQQGDLDRGAQCCDEALALGPLPYDTIWAKAVRGYGRVKGGDVDQGIADLGEAVAWFERSRLRYTLQRAALWLAEGHLRGGDAAAARPLIESALAASREMGYAQLEGLACWLMGECLAAEDRAAAAAQTDAAMTILERIGARNDLARAMMTAAALRQSAGDAIAACRLLDQAGANFQALGTLDEPARVAAARSALASGRAIELLARRR